MRRFLMVRASTAFACVVVALPPSASGQKFSRRPALPAGADTNDVMAYYQYASDVLRGKPELAAEAFWWAHRLAPDFPDALYGAWLASLLCRRGQLPAYMDGDRGVVTSKAFRAIDSLYYRALALNPFVYRRFDRVLFDAYIDIYADRIESQYGRGQLNRAALRFEFDKEVMSDPSLRGWMAYADGRWDVAIDAYTSALKRARQKASLLASRARAAFLKSDYDAAMADMTAALEERRKTEDKDLIRFYDSKAVFEHSIGVIHQLRGDPAAAREAYARALQEDLSYHQGHVRLAALALNDHDTATAISEYDLATQIQGADPVVHYQLGTLLAATGRLGEAAEQLKAAIAAEPVYAPPYRALGVVYEQLKQPGDAAAQYEAFVAHARRQDPELARIRERLAVLRQEATP
jgi:tetratricopeptide (TPR) repeat protein